MVFLLWNASFKYLARCNWEAGLLFNMIETNGSKFLHTRSSQIANFLRMFSYAGQSSRKCSSSSKTISPFWLHILQILSSIIPEQFTVKAHPALFEEEGGANKLRNTFQRLRPEDFSSGDFGLRSFRQPRPKSPAKNSAFSKEGRGEGGKGGWREGSAGG